LELFCCEEDEALCLLWDEPGQEILFPLILRPVPGAYMQGRAVYDLTGPYGYGGPYLVGDTVPDVALFWKELEAWASSRAIVSVFTRLSLFPSGLVENIPSAHIVGENVIRDLSLNEEALWMDYDHKVRKNVNRARREGVSIECDPVGQHFGRFYEIYRSTMDRRAAGEFYCFGQEWFEKLIAGLPGKHLFFHAISNGRIVSTELVLLSRSHMYSFLGGTEADHYDKRPNDLLKHEIILWGKGTGRTHFVLAGGFMSGSAGGVDGILRYKKSFAPHGAAPFRVMRWVTDEAAYSSLVDIRRIGAVAGRENWQPREGFFPAYRA
jgi:hypothetical protein